jgi:hypothetical protein
VGIELVEVETKEETKKTGEREGRVACGTSPRQGKKTREKRIFGFFG